jgi:hypothetical protein
MSVDEAFKTIEAYEKLYDVVLWIDFVNNAVGLVFKNTAEPTFGSFCTGQDWKEACIRLATRIQRRTDI